MQTLLVLRNLTVENANAICGHTYGFPAVSHFLGFTHALSRDLYAELGLSLGGCAIVCHEHQVHAYQPGDRGDYVFALTRNPLTKEGKTSAFVEEGRMNMTVSLVVECHFSTMDLDFGGASYEEDLGRITTFLSQKILSRRLAAGTITNIDSIEFVTLDDRPERATRNLLFSLLPGFVLCDQSQLLSAHFQVLQQTNPEVELTDAWMDFFALKQHAVSDVENPQEGDPGRWEYLPKPGPGWIVPLAVGYKAISPLYHNDEVERTRDAETSFRFVELTYGIGQWQSPHRCRNLNELIWRYHQEDDWYLCRQNK